MKKTKLYNTKQIVIILLSVIIGALLFLWQKYYSTGVIKAVDIIGAISALIMGFIVTFLIVRYANKDEKE